MQLSEKYSNWILGVGCIHIGKLYKPLTFSNKIVITSIDADNDDRATATLCHHMDICEVITIVSIAEMELEDGRFIHCLSTELHEAETTWFLIQGSCFDDSELIYLIVNDKEEFYPLREFDRFSIGILKNFNILPYFIIEKKDSSNVNTHRTTTTKSISNKNNISAESGALESILMRAWTEFSEIDKILIIKAIGIHIEHNYR